MSILRNPVPCVFVAVVVVALPGRVALAAPEASTPAPAPAAEPESARLYVRDGQLLSHPLTIFVNQQIEQSMRPMIRLAGAHAFSKPSVLERWPLTPHLVAPHQVRTIPIAGSDVQMNGTLLIFDVRKHDIPFYKSAVRLLPSVEWTVPAATPGHPPQLRQVVSEDDIYLGNMPGAVLWTFVAVALVLALLVIWSYSKKHEVRHFKPIPALLLITGPDGYLSLWRTQLLLWTVAVGSLVFLFGLVQLHVPEIPESLVALMGMSLLTGLVAKKAAPASDTLGAGPAAAPVVAPAAVPAAAPAPAAPAAAPGAPAAANHGPHFSDLISSWSEKRQRLEFSLPKAQMVMWTVLILVLFCVKSILGGTLWAVPWQMVALTGFSQSGYIGDKYIDAK